MKHGMSLPLAPGAGSSNDLTTQGDLTFRRSKRFKSKVLPYWDFERIACLPTSDGNKTVIARDVPGEGTIILQELHLPSTVEPPLAEREKFAKKKTPKRKMVSQEENTASITTPNKARLSSPPKRRNLFSLSSEFLEGQANVINEESHISGKKLASPSTRPPKLDMNKPVRQSQQANKDKENSIATHLEESNSNKSSRSSTNIKRTFKDSTCETTDLNKPNDADEASAADKAGDPDMGKRNKHCEVIIEENFADGGAVSSPAAASLGWPPTLDDPGYSTGNDSFNSTMAGSELRFGKVAGSLNSDATTSTGQYRIARGVAKNGISVYFIHLSKGYLAFCTPLDTVFIGMLGEGYLKLVNEDKPSLRTKLRPNVEVSAEKGAVVAIGCQEGCPSLTVVMVTMAD